MNYFLAAIGALIIVALVADQSGQATGLDIVEACAVNSHGPVGPYFLTAPELGVSKSTMITRAQEAYRASNADEMKKWLVACADGDSAVIENDILAIQQYLSSNAP